MSYKQSVPKNSWIFSPTSIDCTFSMDGQNFSNAIAIELDALREQKDAATKDVVLEIDLVKARYIKISASKIVGLPEWHKYKGADAWIVLDEVMVE